MKTSDEYNPNLSTGILAYGAGGMGKTSWALQFPEPYIFDADNNLVGAHRRLQALGIKYSYDIGTVDDNGNSVPLTKCYARMVKCLNDAIAAKNPDGTHQFKTVIIDTGSAAGDFIMTDVLTTRLPSKSGEVMDPDTMRIQDWGIYLRRWISLITKLRSAHATVIVNCHENRFEDDTTGKVTYEVNLPGQIRGRIGGMFSDVYHFEIVSEKIPDTTPPKTRSVYAIRTKPTPQMALKCTLDLPSVFPSDDFGLIKKALGLTV